MESKREEEDGSALPSAIPVDSGVTGLPAHCNDVDTAIAVEISSAKVFHGDTPIFQYISFPFRTTAVGAAIQPYAPSEGVPVARLGVGIVTHPHDQFF